MRIYHTSDLHDHRGIVAPLRALRARAPGLLFDCGDSLRGSQTVYHRDEPILAEMNAAGYDAQAIGNREFHYFFAALCARAKRMRYPLVCSNLTDVKGRALPFVRSLRLDTDGHRVHVLGLLVTQYAAESLWERVFGWRFLEPSAAVLECSRDIPDGDMLLVLSHLGLNMDRKLAAAIPRIDLILGGHSHDTLPQPEYVGDVPIVHAGPYGKFASRTDLRRDGSRGRYSIVDFALEPLLDSP